MCIMSTEEELCRAKIHRCHGGRQNHFSIHFLQNLKYKMELKLHYVMEHREYYVGKKIKINFKTWHGRF